jgi:hypothetical protein
MIQINQKIQILSKQYYDEWIDAVRNDSTYVSRNIPQMMRYLESH